MYTKKLLSILKRSAFILLIIAASCSFRDEGKISPRGEDLAYLMVVDTITYDVVIRQIDPEDEWTGNNLKKMNQSLLLDYIFEGIYSGRYKSYDLLSGKSLSADEVKMLETVSGFNRIKLSKTIFNEEWFFDSLGVLNKRVHSISLGIEAYSPQGTFLGHKGFIRVEM